MKTQLTEAEKKERRETHEQERRIIEEHIEEHIEESDVVVRAVVAELRDDLERLRKKRQNQRRAHLSLLDAYNRRLRIAIENVELKSRLLRADAAIAALTRANLREVAG